MPHQVLVWFAIRCFTVGISVTILVLFAPSSFEQSSSLVYHVRIVWLATIFLWPDWRSPLIFFNILSSEN